MKGCPSTPRLPSNTKMMVLVMVMMMVMVIMLVMMMVMGNGHDVAYKFWPNQKLTPVMILKRNYLFGTQVSCPNEAGDNKIKITVRGTMVHFDVCYFFGPHHQHSASILKIYIYWYKCSQSRNRHIQGVFLTGTPPKSSKYKKVTLG